MVNTTNVGVIAIDSNTPISFLTVGQLVDILDKRIISLTPTQQSTAPGPIHLPKEWITREEALKHFAITDPTLNKWVRNGRITRKYLEGKPFYLISSAYDSLNNQQ